MISKTGDRLEVAGAMTFDTAHALLKEGTDMLNSGEAVFDLSAVREVDSTGLTVIFAWRRAAERLGKSIRIVNPPPSLVSLAALYGVTDLLPVS